MQLTRLDIKGFKSFGDKITLHFNDGVTAIVGPNGCGKSNVVDAIRWVLGEQSTKALRSEKMENIIFNGTKSRKAANLAEVSLSFDNTKNILPTEFSQVTITRKLYRNGESEYRLNGVQCRLKDITDLFLDTGIGNDSYSIIELKMVDEIINNKENSRRALFEEASGISKYKVRKKQTLHKLKDTETDLSRVEDLLYEIEKNLKSLEVQAKKAERYYRVRNQYKESSLALASFKIRGFRNDLTDIEERQTEQESQQKKAASSLHHLENKIQKEKQLSLITEKNLAIQQKAVNDYTAKIRTYESEKKVKNEQLRNLNEKKQRLSKELNQDRQQINHVHYNIKRLQEEHLTESESLGSAHHALTEKKSSLDELRSQQDAAKQKVSEIAKKLSEQQSLIYNLEKTLAVVQIQRNALLQESERNLMDTEARETELNQYASAITDLESQIEKLQQEHDDALAAENENLRQISEKENIINDINNQINRDTRLLDAKQNEYNLTKSLVDNLEGFPESIRFVRKNAKWNKAYPLLSDILSCQEAYRIAVENYLEPLMNYYVVPKLNDAVMAIKLLSEASRGRAGFFILEQIVPLDLKPQTLETTSLIPALQVIDVESKYRPLCQHLLQQVYLLDSNAEQDLDKPLPHEDIIILHKGGKFSKSKLGLTGGSVGLFEGKRIGRAKNLESLNTEIKAMSKLLISLQEQVDEQADLLKQLKANTKKVQLEENSRQLNRLNNELISVSTKQEQHFAFIKSSRNRKLDIENKINQLADEIEKTNPKLSQLTNSKSTLANEQVVLQERFSEISDQVAAYSSDYNQYNLRFHQQQNKLAGIEKDLEYREIQYNSLEKRLKEYTQEYEMVVAAIADTHLHVGDADAELITMYTQKASLEEGLQESERTYYEMRGNIHKQEEELTSLRKIKENADVLVAELKDRRNQLKIALSGLKERLSIEFQVDINDLFEEELATQESEDALTQRIAKLKKQMQDFGSINSMAMDAFQEMNERYRFILKEKQDLLDAKGALLNTIREIDNNAKEKFMTAFTQVRSHFIAVFRSLFNQEDSCDLILTDQTSPLESDIEIMARPKGKRPLSINQLSGGEKTLTATALLFSLYLLKPAPFCIFDEVDAPLDDTNIDKFNQIIRKFSDQSQFIIVSHNKRTIASTDIIYGVTMVEPGISKVVAVDMRQV